MAANQGRKLPGDDSLKRMIRLWARGQRTPGEDYAALLRTVFGVMSDSPGVIVDEFRGFLDRGEYAADPAVVLTLEQHTESLRALDRRLGASFVHSQAKEHLRTIAEVMGAAPYGEARRRLAAAGAEAAALGGWQALDMGQPAESWQMHVQARSLALESGDASVAAHVTAQQAYALIDTGRVERAAEHMAGVRREAGTRVPGSVQAWLAAAEAEARAAARDRDGAARLLDVAERVIASEEVPFIVLNDDHLARWRGHCLARLGDAEATAQLEHALERLPPDFGRARAGVLVDLATAHGARGEQEAARLYSQRAAAVAQQVGSQRQLLRARALLGDAERE